jgi:phage portal protein BeeE
VKEEGMKLPPEDAQFLQTRKFQTVEICRLFGVPPHKIAELERSTNMGHCSQRD